MGLWVPGERLGGTELGAAAANTATVSFGNYKYLTIYACVSGYASNGIFSLQFGISNGAIDTGTNYRHRNLLPPATTGTAWQAGVASSTTTADTMMRLAGDSITAGRMTTINIMNRTGTAIHTVEWRTVNEGATDIVHPNQWLGDGTYVSTAAGQITSVRLISTGGNLNAGTGFAVYGFNSL
jgi:hypothetical protein